MDLSILSVVKFFLVVLALIFLYMIKDVLAILFVSLILSSAFDPWVDSLEKIRFPRWLSILLIYVALFLIIAFVVYLLIPPLVTQFSQLSSNFPDYFNKASDWFNSFKSYSLDHGLLENMQDGFKSVKENVSGILQSVFGAISDIFGGIVSFFIILVITFYMTVEETAVKKTFTFFLPESCHEFVLQLINKVQRKIGDWMKGQLILCLIVGVMVYLGLLILGVKYALILALIAAIGEAVPYLGPIMTAIPAVFLAFVQSPIKALLVLILFILVQQLENHILVPKVMQKAVGLNPISSIIALLIGAKIGGIVGMILAIPVATAASVVIYEVWQVKEKSDC